MRRFVAPVLVLLALLATTVRAELDTTQVLAELGNEKYEVREKATHRLLTSLSISPQELIRLYSAATTPEQRYRIMAVAMHHTIRDMATQFGSPSARSSLGISMAGAVRADQVPDLGRSAISIGAVYPGFPAYVELQPGDLIVAVNGQALPANADPATIRDQFVSMVQGSPIGEPLSLSVWRENASVEVSLRPICFDALVNLYETASLTPHSGVTAEGLQAQYLARWQLIRDRIAAGAPAPPPLVVQANPTPAQVARGESK